MPSTHRISPCSWPKDVGIISLEVYIPEQYVCQSELEEFDGVSQGKYTIGLGQSKMGFCADYEDINSLCLNALARLMHKNQLSYTSIGRLEVGTETIVDKSKSVKSVLMKLFEKSGNTDVEGVDSTNACYGGTAALFNCVNWIESSAWDGRYAVAVAGDIAVYATGAARPTGGAGAIAMLIGPHAPLVIERGLRATHMKHVYDFYKPNLSSEYPTVDGKLSIECYLASLDTCYKTLLKKAKDNNFESNSPPPTCLEDFDYFAFHSPFCKLVQKSLARIAFNDFLNCPNEHLSEKYPGLENFRGLSLEKTYFDKDVEKAFISFSKDMFSSKTKPSLLLASEVGNMYTPSLYGGLASILVNSKPENLVGKRIGMFSYGSGLASTMFSIKVCDEIDHPFLLKSAIESASDIPSKLNSRIKITPANFAQAMSLRETAHFKAPYTPSESISSLLPGTWYLKHVDEMHRRQYEHTPIPSSDDPQPALPTLYHFRKVVSNPIPLQSATNGHNSEVCLQSATNGHNSEEVCLVANS